MNINNVKELHLYQLLKLLCKIIRNESESVTLSKITTAKGIFKLHHNYIRVKKLRINPKKSP